MRAVLSREMTSSPEPELSLRFAGSAGTANASNRRRRISAGLWNLAQAISTTPHQLQFTTSVSTAAKMPLRPPVGESAAVDRLTIGVQAQPVNRVVGREKQPGRKGNRVKGNRDSPE